MASITVHTEIAAPPEVVWADVADIASHVSWMADAEAIRFTSATTTGVGTTFDCDTKVGPLRLTDAMEITSWEPGRSMGVRHVGTVVGEGRFTLAATPAGGTRFTWSETLHFPWWMGSRLGALAARPVFLWIWGRNLRRLKARIEGGDDSADPAAAPRSATP